MKQTIYVFLAVLLAGNFYATPVLADWQGPIGDPPDYNRPRPLDESSLAQTKVGSLYVGDVGVLGANDARFNYLTVFHDAIIWGGLTIPEGGVFTLQGTADFNGLVNFNSGINVTNTGVSNAVYGHGSGHGVYGESSGDIYAGIYGTNTGAGWAGYFLGPLGVAGNIGFTSDQVTIDNGGHNSQLCLNGSAEANCIASWDEVGGNQTLSEVLNTGADASDFRSLTIFGGDIEIRNSQGQNYLYFDPDTAASENSLYIGSNNANGNFLKFEQNVGALKFQVDKAGNVTQAGDLAIQGGGLTGANAESISLGETNDVISFTAGGAEKMRIHSNGNVGIGTASPGQQLDITKNLTLAGSVYGAPIYNMAQMHSYLTDTSVQNLMNASVTVTTDSTTPAGVTLRFTGVTSPIWGPYLPIDPNKVYYGRAWVKRSGNATGTLYLGFDNASYNKTHINGNGGTYGYWITSAYNIPNDGAWHLVEGTITGEGASGTQFPSGTRYARMMMLANYGGDAGAITDVAGLEVYESPFSNLLFVGTSSGKVGIGTAAPNEKLEVNAGAGVVSRLRIADTNANENPELQLRYDDSNHWAMYVDKANSNALNLWQGSNRLTVTTAGNVGIGTASPTYKLDVSGDIRTTSALYMGSGKAQYEQQASASVANAGWYRVAHIDTIAGRGQNTVTIYTTGGDYAPRSTTIRWFHDWSTTAGLNIISEVGSNYWSDARVTDDGSNSYLEIYFTQQITTLSLSMQYDGGFARGLLYSGVLSAGGDNPRATAKLGLLTIGTDKLFVSSSGNVGIGTTSPGDKLEVYGGGNILLKDDANDPGDLVFQNSAGIEYGRVYTLNVGMYLRANSARDADIFIKNSDGNVGIGTTNPGAKLEVAGDIKITGGTPGADKVLTSDANGLATWQTPAGSSLWTDDDIYIYANNVEGDSEFKINDAAYGGIWMNNNNFVLEGNSLIYQYIEGVSSPVLINDQLMVGRRYDVGCGHYCGNGNDPGVALADNENLIFGRVRYQAIGNNQNLLRLQQGDGADAAIDKFKVDLAGNTTLAGDLNVTGNLVLNTASINTGEIANGAVTTDKILDGTIAAADIASNAVTTVKILDANVTTAKIADGNVNSAKISDGTIMNADINASAAIAGSKLAAGAISETQLANSAVTSAKISDGTIANDDIANATILFAKIASNSCAASQIMKWNGSAWACADAGGSPGGSNTYVQFNNSGAFGGDAGFTYNSVTGEATIGGGYGNTGITLYSSGDLAINGNLVADGSVLGGTISGGTISGNYLPQGGGSCSDDQILKKSGGNWVCADAGGVADNLGNHITTQPLQVNSGTTGSSPTPQITFANYYDNSGNPSISHIKLYDTYGFGVSSGSDLDLFSSRYFKFHSSSNYDAVVIDGSNGNLTLEGSLSVGTVNNLSYLNSNVDVQIRVDANNNSTNYFNINNGGNQTVFQVDESGVINNPSGDVSINDDLQLGSGDVANIKKSDGDTVIEFNSGNVIIHLGL